MKLPVSLLALLLASPVAAQTTTNCYSNGQWTNCTTSAPPGSNAPSWSDLLQKPNQSNGLPEYLARQNAARDARREQYRSLIDAAYARGDCASAINLAKESGSKNWLRVVTQACTPH